MLREQNASCVSAVRTFRLDRGRLREGVVYKTRTLTGRLFEKQFIVCSFKVTICAAPCRLMGHF